ncbi:LacI family DNA-binding transcriptional regulator [Phaeovulum sp. W22_SRMD_FR3]
MVSKTPEPRNRSFVSAQKVAERAGVSRSAVSRAFTDGASVSDETRLKVMKAAEELGYHVNHLARGLIRERSNIVSLVVSDIANPFQSRLIEAITRTLQAHNRVAMVINTNGDDASAAQALRQSLNYRADATVVLTGTPASSLVDTCLANGQHVILINRGETPRGADRIAVSNAAAAREAFLLHQRAGAKRHVVVSSTNRTPSLVARETAYVEAAADAGAPVEVVAAGPTSYASGAAAARQVFARSTSADAAFCVTDLLALGFMDAARLDFGLSIPQDVGVIGFDDIDQAAWESYGLTTFRQPISEIAAHITALLNGEASGEAGTSITFDAQPVWRRSVKPR